MGKRNQVVTSSALPILSSILQPGNTTVICLMNLAVNVQLNTKRSDPVPSLYSLVRKCFSAGIAVTGKAQDSSSKSDKIIKDCYCGICILHLVIVY